MSDAAKKELLDLPDFGEEESGGFDDGLFKLETERADMGRVDTLRYNILNWVLEESYDRALKELREYLEAESEYPNFHERVNRYVLHGIDLIYAIKTKRHFPGINSLTRAKQQELREKFKEHFRELQQLLKKVEGIEADMRITDARSTIYVVKALWLSCVCILIVAFMAEFVRGLGYTMLVVFDDIVINSLNWAFKMIGM